MSSISSSRRIFVTGGSGYLGRNLLRMFASNGVKAVALARSERAAVVVRSLGATPFLGDLQSASLAEGMEGCTELVHAAADTNHGYGARDQADTNVDGTRRLFAAATTAGIRRGVYVGTESVLLDGRPLVDANESHPLPRKAVGKYSSTKAEAERIALSFSTSTFEVVSVRPRFIWGRDDTTALPHLVDAVQRKAFAFVGGGRYRTSTTHIANACAGIDLALRRGRGGESYFITDGEPVEFRTFVTALLATQGLTPPDKNVPRWPLWAAATVSDTLARWTRGRVKLPITRQALATSAVEVTLNIAKARSELGYAPLISIEEGLAELVAQHAA